MIAAQRPPSAAVPIPPPANAASWSRTVELPGLLPSPEEEPLEQRESGQPRVVVQAHGSRTARPLRWGGWQPRLRFAKSP